MCTYEGSNTSSSAKPGECTKTGGYISNAEIEKILKAKPESKHWYDDKTDADYIVYDCEYIPDMTFSICCIRWRSCKR